MLVTGKQILDDAHKNGYAVGAFNVVNMEMLQAVVTAAEEESRRCSYRPTEGALSYAGYEYLTAMITYAANSVSVPVAFHLDHGGSYKTVMNC